MGLKDFFDQIKTTDGIYSAPMIAVDGDKLTIVAFEYMEHSSCNEKHEFVTSSVVAVYTASAQGVERRLPKVYEDGEEFDPILSIRAQGSPRRASEEVLANYCEKLQSAIDLFGTDEFESALPALIDASNLLFQYEIVELYDQVCPEFFNLIKYKFD